MWGRRGSRLVAPGLVAPLLRTCRVTSLAARPADARRVLTSAAATCALVSGKWPGLCLWQFPHEPPLGLSFWFTSHCLPPLDPGYLWNLQVKLQPIVNLLPDKGRLMDFLLQRRDCKMVILSVCAQSKWVGPLLCCPLGHRPRYYLVCGFSRHSKGGSLNPWERLLSMKTTCRDLGGKD